MRQQRGLSALSCKALAPRLLGRKEAAAVFSGVLYGWRYKNRNCCFTGGNRIRGETVLTTRG